MSEFDSLIDGYEGAPSSEEGERPGDNGEVAGSIPAGLTDSVVEESVEVIVESGEMSVLRNGEPVGLDEAFVLDEPPFDPNDWPEEEPEAISSHGMTVRDPETAAALDEILGVPVVVEPEMDEDTLVLTDLRPLKPDQRPKVGVHFVIYGGVPMPVRRDQFGATEDEFVRSQIDESDTLKDPDGQRRVRADRALRQRYRGYVCGEMSSL